MGLHDDRRENVRFLAVNAVDWLKSEHEVGKTSCDTMYRKMQAGNDTADFSMAWHWQKYAFCRVPLL